MAKMSSKAAEKPKSCIYGYEPNTMLCHVQRQRGEGGCDCSGYKSLMKIGSRPGK